MDTAKMIEVWDGEVGRFWVAEQERYARMNAGFAKQLLAAAAPMAGERVLEVGCGFGTLAIQLGPRHRLVRRGSRRRRFRIDAAGAAGRTRELPHVAFFGPTTNTPI